MKNAPFGEAEVTLIARILLIMLAFAFVIGVVVGKFLV